MEYNINHNTQEQSKRAYPAWFNMHNDYHRALFGRLESLPDVLPQSTARAKGNLARAIKALVLVSARVYGFLQPTYLTARYNQLDIRNMRRWLGAGKARLPAPVPVNLKRLQIDSLLARYNGLFLYWSWRLPKGRSKGLHMYSDDIANEARLAFFKAFIPHCELGVDHCKSVVNKSSLQPVKTSTGKLARRKQVIYDESGEAIRRANGEAVTVLKPIYRIKREFSPSCEKSALAALQKAKYAAINKADSFARSGLHETVFSELEMPSGNSLIEYLEKHGIGVTNYANELGIFTPWRDRTTEKLKAETSFDSVKAYLSEKGLTQFNDCRLDRALKLADRKGILGTLIENSAGFTYAEIADSQGTSEKALLMAVSRFRKDVARYAIA